MPSVFVCFSALDFAIRVADYSLKKGDVIILDDAGLSAMSGDAMTREVKTIGKIFQSIRHRSLVILLTVPSLQSLAKSARVNSDYYMEPQRWDVRSNRTVCKFQHYSHSPITGKAYRSNHIKAYKKLNPITGFTESVKEKMLSISVPLASEHITKEYDAFKKKRMKEFDVGIADMLTREKDKTTAKGLSNKEIVAKIKRKRDDFVLDGKVSHVKVMEEFNCGDAKARNLAKLANLS